jgi:hypothetical protein
MTEKNKIDKILEEFDKQFTDRLLRVTEGKNKDWEDGYNTMVEATRLFMIESKMFLKSKLHQLETEVREDVKNRIINYQNGFVQDDGAGEGNYLFAPEFGVIDELLQHLEPTQPKRTNHEKK